VSTIYKLSLTIFGQVCFSQKCMDIVYVHYGIRTWDYNYNYNKEQLFEMVSGELNFVFVLSVRQKKS